jgi:type II secretory ATPase GspE/PulE/Tfp pilus assembly ATPase PilB-like protein
MARRWCCACSTRGRWTSLSTAFEASARDLFRDHIKAPHGLILVTGPTGSGKSTTLYAALNELNQPDLNISTVEDPIEYEVEGVNQTQVKPEIGITFGYALRSFLRQDPDILMVGEIRDTDTAEIAVRAALTGHLVLSTLHTNDAPAAVTRLVDMGIEPFLVAATLRLIVAQRLLRTLCAVCRGGGTAPGSFSTSCPHCSGGYKGRTAVFEVMPVSDSISGLIAKGTSAASLRTAAISEGMVPLRDAARAKVIAGVTDEAEVLRSTV